MRPNPLLPRTLADETAFPIDLLRIALTGEATGRVNATGRVIGQLDAARTVAQAWTSALPREDRDGTAKFYVGVLTSFLTGKSPHTVRSWSGTVCDFFDFVAHDRVKRGAPDLRLVAPHDLMQADVDGYVAMLSRGRDASPEMIVDPQEKLVAEWLYDAYQRNPARAFLEREIAEEMDAEKLSWRTQPPGKVLKGFQGKQTGLRAILSALVRKKVLVRSPTAKEAKAQRHGDGRKKYPYDKARYTRPSGMKPATVATQVQRLTALVNLWAAFNDDASLDIQEEFRPRVLRKNPWLKPRKSLFARMTKPSDDTARSLRRMYPDDLLALLSMLRKRATPKGRGVSIRNILAKRDELAVLFLTGTGLRVFEALQAKVENMAPAEGGALWTVSGIKRKLGGDPATVFVPRLVMETRDDLRAMIYEYVKKTTDLFSAEWEKSKAEVQGRSPDLADEELGRQIEMGMREFSNKHRKEDFFREQFGAYLNLKESGPLLPALGRWGNAMTKARATLQTESGSAVVVPWDENSIRDRLLLMAPKGNPLRQRLHPHAFRHLAVALAEAATPGAMAAMALAGHKDSRTTDLYRDTVSLRRAATLAIEGRLREMLATASGAVAPAPEPVKAGAEPTTAPGTMPQAAQPQPAEFEPKLLSLLPLPTQQEYNQIANAADLTGQRKAIADAPQQSVSEMQISSQPQTPLAPVPQAAGAPEPIFALGKMGSKELTPLDPAATKGKPIKKDDKVKRAPSEKLKRAGEEFMVWSTPPDVWFMPASRSWSEPVPITSHDLVTEVFAKGYIPGRNAVSQWGLAPPLANSLVWTGVRTLLPYRIAMNTKVEKVVTWTKESLGAVPAPGGPKQFSKNARSPILPESLVAIPIVNFDDPDYLQELGVELKAAYDMIALDDLSAAKAFTRWLIDIRAHYSVLKLQIAKENEAAKKEGKPAFSFSWISPESVAVPLKTDNQVEWGSAGAVKAVRSQTLRNHFASEVVEFIRSNGSTIHGPVGKAIRAEDYEKYDNFNEQSLQHFADSIEELQRKTRASGKPVTTSVPRGLRKYALPTWVTDTDDPLGHPALGVHGAELEEMKKWLLSVKSLQDIVSFESDSKSRTPHASPAPYWALVSRFALDPDAVTIECPAEYAAARMAYAARNKVDPVVASRRAVRHLWEASKALKKPMNKADVDQLWGVFWSWILPSVGMVKDTLRKAAEEAGKTGDYTDVDHVRRVTNRWMDVATIQSLMGGVKSEFARIYQLARAKHVASATRDAVDARMFEFVNSEAQALAKSMMNVLWNKMGDDPDSITAALEQTIIDFNKGLDASYSMIPDAASRYEFLRMKQKEFDERMERMRILIDPSVWTPPNKTETFILSSRKKMLEDRGMPVSMASFVYEDYAESHRSYRALILAYSAISKMTMGGSGAIRALATGAVLSAKEALALAAKEGAPDITALAKADSGQIVYGALSEEQRRAYIEQGVELGIQGAAAKMDEFKIAEDISIGEVSPEDLAKGAGFQITGGKGASVEDEGFSTAPKRIPTSHWVKRAEDLQLKAALLVDSKKGNAQEYREMAKALANLTGRFQSKPKKLYVFELRKFLGLSPASASPEELEREEGKLYYTPNRSAPVRPASGLDKVPVVGLAPVYADESDAVSIMRRIRINPIALILALYA